MKVKELISQLKSYNPQARVVVDRGDRDDDDHISWDYIDFIHWAYKDNGDKDERFVEIS
jgi:hypothetical protein